MSDDSSVSFCELAGEAPHKCLSFPELEGDPQILRRASRRGYDPDVAGRAWCRLAGITDGPSRSMAITQHSRDSPVRKPYDYGAASIAAAWCDLAGTDVEAATRLATEPLARPRKQSRGHGPAMVTRRARSFMSALEQRFHSRRCRIAPAARWAVGTTAAEDDEHQSLTSPTRTASPTSAGSDEVAPSPTWSGNAVTLVTSRASTLPGIRFRRAPQALSRMETFPVICHHRARTAADGQADPRVVSLMAEYGLWYPPRRS